LSEPTNGSGKWATYQSSDTFNGYWNNGGTPTAPTGTKYGIYRLYVSKDDINSSTPTYWAVLDDQEYNNLAAAQLAVADDTASVATAELAKLEFAQLGLIIYKQSTSEIIEVEIVKSVVGSGVSSGGGSTDAALITTNVSSFDGILSASDTTVQVALDTIDDWGKDTVDHAILIGSGTGNPIDSLAVGTNGQVVVGSTGADPVFATISSSDSSITFATGAGTLGITGTQSTTSQLGSVELATDAEAIAGSDTARPIVPSSLAAKLGTQTDHGVLVGSGTAAAVTALTVGTNGQVLLGSTGADPVFATLTSTDTSVSFTPGAGTLDLSVGGTIAINDQTGTTYTLVLSDAGKIVRLTNGAAITFTVPPNSSVAFSTGTIILFEEGGAGVVTVTEGSGVTVNSRGSFMDTNGIYAAAALIKIDTNEWTLSGDLV